MAKVEHKENGITHYMEDGLVQSVDPPESYKVDTKSLWKRDCSRLYVAKGGCFQIYIRSSKEWGAIRLCDSRLL